MSNNAVRDAFASVNTPAELESILQEVEALAVETAARVGYDLSAEARALPPIRVPDSRSG